MAASEDNARYLARRRVLRAPRKAVRMLAEAAVGSSRLLPGRSTLQIKSRGCGFFGDVFMTLNGIRFAERHGLRCSVNWGAESLYFDSEARANAWSNYFREAEFDFARTAGPSRLRIPFYPDADNFAPYPGLSVRRSAGRAIAQWCVLRPELQAEVDVASERLLAPRHNLAMHIRLTDAARGHEARNTVHLDQFLAEGREWLTRFPDGRIFLATDDAATIARFAAAFGGRVSWQDCLRSTDGKSIHGHYDGGIAGSAYRKGVEVIIDAWLMSRCDHLVRLASRVTGFSLCLNPAQTFTDLEVKHFGFDRAPWLNGAEIP